VERQRALTAEEVADLISPSPAIQFPAWLKPLSAYDRPDFICQSRRFG
jgi:hypothetical protein